MAVEVVAVGGAKGARQRITAGKVCFQPSLGTPAYVPVGTIPMVELIGNKVLAAGRGLEGVGSLLCVLESVDKVDRILAAYERILMMGGGEGGGHKQGLGGRGQRVMSGGRGTRSRRRWQN